MEKIIQQIVAKVVEEILTYFEENGFQGIDRVVTDLTPKANAMVLEIIAGCLQQMDEALTIGAKKKRKEDGIRIKERNVDRSVLTKLGELRFQRTYFQLADGSYEYLLDSIAGIEKHSRISADLVAAILQAAAENSYRKAIETSGQEMSKQTVHNRLIALDELVVDVEQVEETPEELDLFADEDHVHLTPKGRGIVPYVTITEGMDTTDPKRHKTIHPLHIAGFGMSAEAFQENVLAVVTERYDLDKVLKIRVHADSGSWIKSLSEVLPHAELVIDGFHLEKELKKFFRLDSACFYAPSIRYALKNNDIEKFTTYCNEVFSRQKTDKEREKAHDFMTYVISHWDAIALRMSGEVCGSCTEPLVSHLLSERLSRDPIAWSRDGLSKMTMLLIYTKNGGVVTTDKIHTHPVENAECSFKENGYTKYKEYADKQIETVLDGHYNWDLFEKKSFDHGKIDASYIIRKAFGSIRPLSIA